MVAVGYAKGESPLVAEVLPSEAEKVGSLSRPFSQSLPMATVETVKGAAVKATSQGGKQRQLSREISNPLSEERKTSPPVLAGLLSPGISFCQLHFMSSICLIR